MSGSTIAAFKSISTDHLPDVHHLDEQSQVLWVLAVAKLEPSIDHLTGAEIAAILQEVCGIAMTRQRVTAMMRSVKGLVAINRRNGIRTYRIMKRGEDALLEGGFKSVLVDPEKPLTSIRRIEEIFGQMRGEIRICDPYFSGSTLDYISQSPQAASFRVLTENIQNSSRTKRDISAYAREHSKPLEIRLSKPGKIHDRYVIHDGGIFFVGASIKDLGKKQSIVVQLSGSIATEVARAFDREWNGASSFHKA